VDPAGRKAPAMLSGGLRCSQAVSGAFTVNTKKAWFKTMLLYAKTKKV